MTELEVIFKMLKDSEWFLSESIRLKEIEGENVELLKKAVKIIKDTQVFVKELISAENGKGTNSK